MEAKVLNHRCRDFGELVRAVLSERTPHPLSYDVEQNGCRAVVRCSSKLAWISARVALRRCGEVLTVRGVASHGRYMLRVGVAGVA